MARQPSSGGGRRGSGRWRERLGLLLEEAGFHIAAVWAELIDLLRLGR